ncbi:hypothetical protein [uncultured Capnocytophaga sp.]|uniref:hypothetical protein n=1 Tax=uncultured Capnocytophaga sp. TaxID=159273 RepID=UPI00261FE509|nr:hypothetical protein [uncultured Capnocytophaga sp.]
MRKGIQATLLIASLIGLYLIYKSIQTPIEFARESKARYAKVIAVLKDIRKSEEAYEAVNKTYTNSFDELEKFIENGQFYITTQRDTSWTEFDKHFKIDVLKQNVVTDTIGKVLVKDSLFKGSDRYKQMASVTIGDRTIPIKIETGVITRENEVKFPVFEVKISKKDILEGLDEEEIEKELQKVGVNDIKGPYVSVGSMTEVSSSGNWPSYYNDKSENKSGSR